MLASILMQKLFAKATENYPVISDNCIKNMQRHYSCSVCTDTCKEKVFMEDGPHFGKCTNCNLCLVACPVQAILPPAFLMQQIIRNVETNKNYVHVYCRKRDGLGDVNISCLASLPWEIYAALALNKKVIISLLPCNQCEYATFVISLLNKIKETMGEDFFRDHFSFSDNVINEKGMSRREMLQSLKIEGWSAAEYVISFTNSFNSGGLFYRKYLLRKLLQPEYSHIGCSWKSLVFYKDCWGCGLCATVCPNQAITIIEKEDGKSCLVNIPWRCTQCGLCKKYCPDNCIEGWKLLERSVLLKQKVFIDINTKYCPNCNKTMRPVTNGYFCYYCGHKERTQHLQGG
jgi:NAD-dependent dihydropyrimidine dehydrogenase PreA subunit